MYRELEKYIADLHTDGDRMDFLERHSVDMTRNYYFTILTQHVDKHIEGRDISLREFCDLGIEFERMFQENLIDRNAWFMMYGYHDIYLNAWFNEHRKVNAEELKEIKRREIEYREKLRWIMKDTNI